MPYDRFGRQYTARILRKVPDPIGEQDAINLRTLNNKIAELIANYPTVKKDVIDFKGKRLSNVGYPQLYNDGVNHNYLAKSAIMVNKGVYDATDHRITKIKDPVDKQDAVTLGFLKKEIGKLKTDNGLK